LDELGNAARAFCHETPLFNLLYAIDYSVKFRTGIDWRINQTARHEALNAEGPPKRAFHVHRPV
jgi:hypothetical protein